MIKNDILKEIGIPEADWAAWSGPYLLADTLFVTEGPRDALVFRASTAEHAIRSKAGTVERGTILEVRAAKHHTFKTLVVEPKGAGTRFEYRLEGDEYTAWIHDPNAQE